MRRLTLTQLSVSPATAIALVALFFALGGSAFAVGERLQSLTASQPRCANGAVRGIAVVTGGAAGTANIPGQFSGSASLFTRKFNCRGGATQVRRISIGIYEVRFVGNSAPTAVAGGFVGGYAAAELVSPGVFRVGVYSSGRGDPEDRPFVVVAV
jgi:hypothetical protein